MLHRARPSGLCHGCRQDVQTLFERGFCGPVVSLKSRPAPLQWRRPFRPRQQVRPYVKSPTAFQERSNSSSERIQFPVEPERGLDADTLQEQLDAIQELEHALGRPIEQAIEEDRVLNEGLIELDVGEHVEEQYDQEVVLHATKDSVASLRESGASLEEVVRLARQIHGDSLPDSVLEGKEFKIYRRLYGDPVAATKEYLSDEDEVDGTAPNQLFDRDGELVDYDLRDTSSHMDNVDGQEDATVEPPPPVQDNIHLESDETTSLLVSPTHRAMEVARLVDGQIAEDVDEEDAGEDSQSRFHPLTVLGKFATNPKTVFLSQEDFVLPVANIMKGFSNKHLKDACEKTFGGPGLPDSALTPRSGRSRAQVPIPLDATQHSMGEMEANAFITTVMPPTYAAITSVLVETRKRLGSTWLNNLLAKEGGPRILDAGAGGAAILAWREIVKAHWDSMHSSDCDPPPAPASKSVVLTGADSLRHRAAALLDNTTFIPRLPDYVHTRDAPTLDDDRPAQQRKQFDVIIASHSLFGLQEDWMRKQHVQNYWSMLSNQGGVLILIEKGVPRGFEAIAGARELLLERHIAVPKGRKTGYSAGHESDEVFTRETGMIVAPCTNHEKCPMYNMAGLSQGRKDFCSFQQRYTRPTYLQRVLGAKDRNHDDVDFSYLSVMKGDDLRQRKLESWKSLEDGLSAPLHPKPQVLAEDYDAWMTLCQSGFDEVDPSSTLRDSASTFADGKVRSSLPAPWNLPRLVFTPMKRRGHVIMDVCTPAGKIERWTVPKSFSKQAYHDARKSQWGDLWALGAKTRTLRTLRLGGPDTKEAKRARSRKERLQNQADDLMERMEEEKMADMEEAAELQQALEIEDFDDHEPRMHVKKQKSKAVKPPTEPSKAKQPEPSPGVESFTFDDFDENEINPLPPSKAGKRTRKGAGTVGNGNVQATGAHTNKSNATNSTIKHDWEETATGAAASRYDDLDPLEAANLREWEAELAAPLAHMGIKGKGESSTPSYSKFAVRADKRRKQKVGRARRGRSGL
ncbi:hypothetical protein A1O3_09830 [Capronia epimyces CBS 606.96]|uniref:37S ribosomal protein S22 n=1 Tax=Capronia epimyces CBS 606.96 TaxID=1182542 RepID=W9XBK2_9EURO|nr:uncharacterized protein A1O3_09830 [Capronia epimyces CBS 606.96]EXJ77603.1 hypothetical protein A1O3_09830 [Capronia epimyces CBS 606.96]